MPDVEPTFEEQSRVRLPLDDGLRAAVRSRYGFDLAEDVVHVDGGDECAIWRAGDVVVRIAPAWRSDAELEWVHSLVGHVARSVREAVAPVVAADGRTAFRHDGHPVSLYPFIEGELMDRTPPHVRAAGALLARVHAAIATWAAPGSRPPSGPGSPRARPRIPASPELRDDALDAWHEALESETRSVIHGDVYRRNILVRNGTIVGLVDWDEAHEDVLAQEIAWTMWECSKVGGPHMDDTLAAAFLDGYASAGGRLPHDFARNAPNHIRWRLRREIADQLTAREHGEAVDENYLRDELTAFTALPGADVLRVLQRDETHR